MPPENTPSFVHVVVGPELTPTLSDEVKFDTPELPPSTVSVVGLKATDGDIVSTTGGGGGGVLLEEDPPPPQAESPKAINAIALTCNLCLIAKMNLQFDHTLQNSK